MKQSVAHNRASITKRLELLGKRMLVPVVYDKAIAFLRIKVVMEDKKKKKIFKKK